uniref:Uncharacterized protein n=1 Tax=Anguilla anguilla TaxID=7936 RepID=A0A0E9SM76_ANGAN
MLTATCYDKAIRHTSLERVELIISHSTRVYLSQTIASIFPSRPTKTINLHRSG